MKYKKIVIGSKNKAKLKEWGEFLSEVLPAVGVSDLGDFTEPEETGETFLENAKIKAIHYAKLTNQLVFADDGGFEVDFLGGRPGVRSRRVFDSKKDVSDIDIVWFILKSLQGVQKEKRTAKLTAAVVLADPKGKIIYEDQGSIGGLVPESVDKVSVEGYPYRDLLFLESYGKLYSELSQKEHQKINHKKKLAKKIIKFIKQKNA